MKGIHRSLHTVAGCLWDKKQQNDWLMSGTWVPERHHLQLPLWPNVKYLPQRKCCKLHVTSQIRFIKVQTGSRAEGFIITTSNFLYRPQIQLWRLRGGKQFYLNFCTLPDPVIKTLVSLVTHSLTTVIILRPLICLQCFQCHSALRPTVTLNEWWVLNNNWTFPDAYRDWVTESFQR